MKRKSQIWYKWPVEANCKSATIQRQLAMCSGNCAQSSFLDKLTSALFRRQWLTESRLAPFCPAFVSPCANISPGLKGYYAVCAVCTVVILLMCTSTQPQCSVHWKEGTSVEILLMCSLPLECESSARGACVCWQPWETVSNCPPPPPPTLSSPACIFIVSPLHPYPLPSTKRPKVREGWL